MSTLTIEVPDVLTRRLEALGAVSGKSVEELALEGLDSFVGSRTSRRAILKSRRDAAKAAGTSYSLADLGWLDGYAGQSVDELLQFKGSEGADPILFAIGEAIEAKINSGGTGKVTGVELMILSVLALEREVNNGGYDQYFRNSSRRFAPVVVNHLIRIGCAEIAEITQQALGALDLPAVTLPAIEAAMETESVARDRALNRCDQAFYEQTGLSEQLFTYVKAHQDGLHA